MNTQTIAKINNISAMVIFGTIGVFVRYIPLSSAVIAFARGLTGSAFLLVLSLIIRKKPSIKAISANLVLLLLSGGAIGINWIFLFESYKYTTVATATLCYYLAPVFLTVLSPLVFKEKLGIKKLGCIVLALIGMVFVSGILNTGVTLSQANGIMFGIGAAMFYATVIILNKFLRDITALDRTIVQLASAAAVILPYMLLSSDIGGIHISALSAMLLLTLGVLHTGIAYGMYFGSLKSLSSQTVAILSYIDPVTAIILSAVLLKEGTDVYGIIGAVLILSSTFISEFRSNKS